jgi:hypothetical protein
MSVDRFPNPYNPIQKIHSPFSRRARFALDQHATMRGFNGVNLPQYWRNLGLHPINREFDIYRLLGSTLSPRRRALPITLSSFESRQPASFQTCRMWPRAACAISPPYLLRCPFFRTSTPSNTTARCCIFIPSALARSYPPVLSRT